MTCVHEGEREIAKWKEFNNILKSYKSLKYFEILEVFFIKIYIQAKILRIFFFLLKMMSDYLNPIQLTLYSQNFILPLPFASCYFLFTLKTLFLPFQFASSHFLFHFLLSPTSCYMYPFPSIVIVSIFV